MPAILLLALAALAATATVLAVRLAPSGWEDDDGFHPTQ